MLLPRSHIWTPLQKAGIVTAGVVALILFCAVVYVYERDYRGPSGSVFCGTWEVLGFDDGPVYLQLNPDQTFSMFSLFEGEPNPFTKGRWYAGGPNIYLRFNAEDFGGARPLVWQIVDIQPEQFRVRYGSKTQILTFRRAHLNSPSASNQAMQRTASKAATDVLCVCHSRFGGVARWSGLAVADLVSR